MKNKERFALLLVAGSLIINGSTLILLNKKGNKETKSNTTSVVSQTLPTPTPNIFITETKSIDEVAYEVSMGRWGNGSERREALEKAGYDYESVMIRVNEIVAERHKTEEEKQQEAEESAKIDAVAREVVRGLWGNMPERKEKLEEAGYDYEKVRSRVNQIMSETKSDENDVQEKEPITYTISGNVGYANVDTQLFDSNLSPIVNVPQYQKIILYNDYLGENRHVCIPNVAEGYMYVPFITLIPDTYVEVDISDQKLYMYKDGELVLNADVITGKPSKNKDTNTDVGYTQILSKLYNTTLNGNTWKDVYVDYFIQFNNNAEGFHDADGWRKDSDYDNKELYKTNGSHGCVNMKQEDVELLDYYTEIGTPVLIHK